jgi:hypothetical protein
MQSGQHPSGGIEGLSLAGKSEREEGTHPDEEGKQYVALVEVAAIGDRIGEIRLGDRPLTRALY